MYIRNVLCYANVNGIHVSDQDFPILREVFIIHLWHSLASLPLSLPLIVIVQIRSETKLLKLAASEHGNQSLIC